MWWLRLGVGWGRPFNRLLHHLGKVSFILKTMVHSYHPKSSGIFLCGEERHPSCVDQCPTALHPQGAVGSVQRAGWMLSREARQAEQPPGPEESQHCSLSRGSDRLRRHGCVWWGRTGRKADCSFCSSTCTFFQRASFLPQGSPVSFCVGALLAGGGWGRGGRWDDGEPGGSQGVFEGGTSQASWRTGWRGIQSGVRKGVGGVT